MTYMATLEDNAFDLAIVDPPYGIGEKLTKGGGAKGWSNRVQSGADKWDVVPTDIYWTQLIRCSKNQIVWGANHFKLPPSRGVIAWDKKKDHDKNSSHWEMAWTSFDCIAKLFRFCNNGGFVQAEKKIHPTQKPVALYKWLLKNYAKPGQRILDTHLGSGSSAIAAHYFGCDFVGCELDADYYNDASERFKKETRQIDMFGGNG
jgi:site-specific DNA-methyltransferase (adenine-specific)